MEEKLGSEIILDALKKEGVEYIFGYQGGSVIPIFDRLEQQQDIKVIVPRHEQGAAHAADGYARATGKPGVCLATSGPGATNLVTGIATAYMDSVPMVAITGQVATNLIGNDAFQEADLTGITRPITKHNYLVKSVDDLPRIIKEAFYVATTGRPGPVLIDLPVNITKGKTKKSYPEQTDMRGYKPSIKGNSKQIKEAAKMIKAAERPVVYSGGGIVISEASDELRTFIKKTGIPITTTLLGLGTYPTNDELFLGMPGMHGLIPANYAITECDLLIAVGSRFDDRVTGKLEEFAPKAKIIHIDIDPTSVSKNVEVDLPIVGDAKLVLEELSGYVEHCEIQPWRETVARWKEENPLLYKDDDNEIKPQYVLERMSEILPDDAVISTEVGQHQMWTAQFYNFRKPRTLLTSGGLGTMGYGLPAAIGAQVGQPDKIVVDVAGDGSVQMNIQELATIASYDLPVKIIILNNQYLGMVRQWQELFFEKNYAGTCLSRRKSCPAVCNRPTDDCPAYVPNFIKLADAYNINAKAVYKKSELDDALKECFEHKGPYLLDIRIVREENVMPMVPAGEAIHRMLQHGLS